MDENNETLRYSPVVIPTLNRFTHLKRCIESLANCSGADKTILIIGLDYPPGQKYYDGYFKIKDFLPKVTGFQNVVVINAKENLGAVNNCRRLYDYVISLGFNKCIFTEDDNEFSPNFLEFINKGFSMFEADNHVMAVCGYLPPQISGNVNGCFLGNMFTAWGAGIWLNKKYTYQTIGEKEYLNNVLYSWKDSLRLFRLRSDSLQGFLSMHFKKEIYGDVFKTAEILLEDRWCLYPEMTKVRNWGHDGSGVNCNNMKYDIYSAQKIDEDDHYSFVSTQIQRQCIAGYTDKNIWRKIVILFRYFVFRAFDLDLLDFYYRKRI